MLAKPNRFHGHNSLRYTYTRGNQVRGRQVSIRYAFNKNRTTSRCAVVVSKKVTKSAPVRNRIRRRIYEVIRLQWPMIKPGHDIIITVFDEHIAQMPAQLLREKMIQLLDKADLLKS